MFPDRQQESTQEIIPQQQTWSTHLLSSTQCRRTYKKPTASKEANPFDNQDDTHVIEIQYDDDGDFKSSLFKTRGRHTVNKVLKMACRTFGIPNTNNLQVSE